VREGLENTCIFFNLPTFLHLLAMSLSPLSNFLGVKYPEMMGFLGCFNVYILDREREIERNCLAKTAKGICFSFFII